MHRGLLAIALMLVSCATGRATWDGVHWPERDLGAVLERIAPDAAPGERMALAFRPPNVANARVLFTHDRTYTNLVSSSRWAARMTLARSSGGWSMSYADHVFVHHDGEIGDRLSGAGGVVERLSDLGEWLGADGIERFVDASTAPGEAALTGFVRDRLRARVLSRLAADWNSMVYLWAGRSFEIGTVWETVRLVPSPGGSPVQMRSTFAYEGRVPCAVGSLGPDCVRLRLRSAPLESSLPTFVLEVFEERHPEAVGRPAQVLAGTVSEEIVVITEPATLLPHRFSRLRSVRGRVESGGTAHQVESTDLWTRTWVWD